jgi:hypothetical protein
VPTISDRGEREREREREGGGRSSGRTEEEVGHCCYSRLSQAEGDGSLKKSLLFGKQTGNANKPAETRAARAPQPNKR